MEVLDKIDYKILQMLIHDGRTALSTISKEVGLSDVAIKRRIERLEKKKVLRGFSAILDLESLGLAHPVFVGLRTELPKTAKVVQELSKSDYVCSVYQTIGHYNIFIKVIAPDLNKTRQFIDSLSRVDGILDTNSSLTLATLKDERYAPIGSLSQTGVVLDETNSLKD